MTPDTIAAVAARSCSRDLQHVRRTLEAEAISACQSGERGTQAHVGRLEMLAAVGAELSRRGHLLPFPPFEEVSREECVGGDPVALSFAVRVF